MKKRILKSYLKSSVVIMLLSFSFSSCDKNNEPGVDDEPNTNPKNIIGKWQKSQVVDDDNTWIEGDLDEYWIYKADGTFENEDSGEITTTGVYEIKGSILTIYSHSVEDPNETENFSGEFYFSHGHMYYDFVDLNNGERSIILFKKM